MKYKLNFLLLVLALTACFNAERNDSGTIIEQQTKGHQLDNSMASEQKSPPSLDTKGEEHIEQTKNELQKLIDVKHGDEPKKEVSMDHFIDMDYLVLVLDELGPFTELQPPWYKYALLGSSYDSYEKGVSCYNEVNLLYEKWQIDSEYERLKEMNGEERTNYHYRRHIIAFSPDGERILLETELEPPYSDKSLYEVYNGLSLFGSYVYWTFIPERNYTKGLKFVTLEPKYYDDISTFYEICRLSNDSSTQEAKQYDISVNTDSNDTLYYRKGVNPQGKCISIYSTDNNEWFFQSQSLDSYPDTVDILDNRLIAGFAEETNSDYLNYIEINMETKEVNYLFTGKKGSFSPDGKYFAYPARDRKTQGYNIYSVESGEMAYISSYETDTGLAINNYVCCWVRKDRVEKMKEWLTNAD